MNKTIISDPVTYDINNLFFEKPKEQSTKLSNGSTINFFRVNIKTKNPDGKTSGDLILTLDKSFCLGISDKFGADNLSALMLLWDSQKGPTNKQTKTKELIDAIVEKCKDWLFVPENKKAVKKMSVKREELTKMNPLRTRPNENGDYNDADSPLFAVRLTQSKERTDKNGNIVPAKISTGFFSEDEKDSSGNQLEINPLSLINKKFNATIAIKVEDIFIGKDISIQFKLLEAVVKTVDSGPKRLLAHIVSTENEDDEDDTVIDISESVSDNTTNDTLISSDNEEEEEQQYVAPVSIPVQVVSATKKGKNSKK